MASQVLARMIGVVINIRPVGADKDTLEADREKMLLFDTPLALL
jgi:hypothetical protein